MKLEAELDVFCWGEVRELWLDPDLESWFWFFVTRPGPVGAIAIDDPTVPFQGFFGVHFDDSTLQFSMPPHFSCLDGF